MWDFPSSHSFTGSVIFSIFCLLVLSAISVFCWINVYRSLKDTTRDTFKTFLKSAAFGGITLLVVLFISYYSIFNYRELNQCRYLDLQTVKALRIRKVTIANQEISESGTIIFKDAEKIQEGLKSLRKAYTRTRGAKERFVNGYRIELMIDGNSPMPISLRYFAENQKKQTIDTVILNCGDSGSNLYVSTDFGGWLRANIEPEFKKVK